MINDISDLRSGPTSLITDEARSEYEELLELLRQDDIEVEITDRVPTSAAGVTWVEITELWVNTGVGALAGWAIGKALDAVNGRVKQWLKSKRRRKAERLKRTLIGNSGHRASSSNLVGEPERRIDVDPDGNMTEFRWVNIEKGEQTDDESSGHR
jgi:hypothetical protein